PPAQLAPLGTNPPRADLRVQTRPGWIPPVVLNGSIEMLFIANDAVKALFLPQRTGQAKQPIDYPGRMSLPALEDALQRLLVAQQGPHNRVNVVRHDHVACQLVSLPVKVVHGGNDLPGRG